jgi:hypothetical protein
MRPEIGAVAHALAILRLRQRGSHHHAVLVEHADGNARRRRHQAGTDLLLEVQHAAVFLPVEQQALHDVVELAYAAVDMVGIGAGLGGSGREGTFPQVALLVMYRRCCPEPQAGDQHRAGGRPGRQGRDVTAKKTNLLLKRQDLGRGYHENAG